MGQNEKILQVTASPKEKTIWLYVISKGSVKAFRSHSL